MRAALLALLLVVAAPFAARAQPNPDPVVVELFTAQGCEECWKANAVLMEVARRPDVVALTFPVDYWDYLGWQDTFAHPAFSWRQRAYKRAMKLRELPTPQVVVDGASHASGFDRGEVLRLVEARRRAPPSAQTVRIIHEGERVLVRGPEPPPGGAEVLLIRFDPRVLQVAVDGGENKGRTVPHKNVVREVLRLGPWTGRGRTYTLPTPPFSGLRSVVVVQALGSRRILACSPPR